jgi:uncharacterized membrane protein YhaH (DUF805 family)
MSNPYGWSPPTNGQPAVYFAPPGQNVPLAAPAAYGTGYAAYGTGNNTAYGTRNASYGTSNAPYDNGYGASPSFVDQYNYRPPVRNPLAVTPGAFASFQSLSARGARQKVTMAEALILWLRNWNNFSGRASRSEYWWIRVVQSVGQIMWWLLLIGVVQMKDLSPTDAVVNLVVTIALLVTSLVSLVMWVPTLSLTVRRLHDTDHGGWYVVLRYIPFGSWFLWHALRKDSDPAGFRFDDSTNRPYGVADID